MANTSTMTTTQVAQEFETDAKTLRRFLRSDVSGVEKVGQGGRYALPGGKRELVSLKKKFDGWHARDQKERSERKVEEAKTDDD